jgi:hypothetical protein
MKPFVLSAIITFALSLFVIGVLVLISTRAMASTPVWRSQCFPCDTKNNSDPTLCQECCDRYTHPSSEACSSRYHCYSACNLEC